MLASDSLIQALNRQIGNEMGASMLYIAIATHFDSEALPQLAQFFYRQSEEERAHAMRFVKFVLDIEGRVAIPAIPAPRADFASAEDAVEMALESEKAVTEQILELVEEARSEKNYFALRFLDWFVDEQLEEQATMSDLLQVVRRAGPDGLLHVEDHLARSGGTASKSAVAGA